VEEEENAKAKSRQKKNEKQVNIKSYA